ncbi:transcription regulator [Dacryopinax primogenitus]|uniref:Transcription regulator n=1 Tax=Dacryopinax primogenitus (strain DJM 731) TaxID=1858805 RepID=M5FXC6_DACPD|nr:transcription regulator [Dacryopinax primogenitus]EJU01114.1 transcription regulator [Dacryopinax primogenitus]
MAVWNRKKKQQQESNGEVDDQGKEKKGNWRRPANTAFKQQRLKAWQPILTPRTVLPTLFIIGLIFAPIGGLLIWGSNLITELTLDYTQCDTASSSFSSLPSFTYKLRSADAGASFSPPQWSFVPAPQGAEGEQGTCTIQFDVPADMGPSVFVYYKLTNFFQNHRRYVKSLDSNQLQGKAPDANALSKGNCSPLDSINGIPIYPCGLIANSIYNDTIGNFTPVSAGTEVYNFTSSGIAWPGEAKKYVSNPGYANLSLVSPPPNWHAKYGDRYNASSFPDLQADEHFQVWMRTAGLPTFTKLYGRNDSSVLPKGRYQVVVGMNFPVEMFGGTKSIVISTVSWVGGKNSFLGWAYVGTAALFVALALVGLGWHCVKPRRLGDMSLLSWNQGGR